MLNVWLKVYFERYCWVQQYESEFRQVFSPLNAQGYQHWWQLIATHTVERFDHTVKLEDQRDVWRDEVGKKFIQDYGVENATAFFEWYLLKYSEAILLSK